MVCSANHTVYAVYMISMVDAKHTTYAVHMISMVHAKHATYAVHMISIVDAKRRIMVSFSGVMITAMLVSY